MCRLIGDDLIFLQKAVKFKLQFETQKLGHLPPPCFDDTERILSLLFKPPMLEAAAVCAGSGFRVTDGSDADATSEAYASCLPVT